MKVGDENIEKNILEQTKTLLLKYGIKGWNMSDLALSCSMSKRTLYKIIGSKEELLHKMIYNNLSKSIHYIEVCMEKDLPFAELQEEWLYSTIRGFKGYLLMDIKVMHFEFPAIAKMMDEMVARQENNIRRLFEIGIERGYYSIDSSIDTHLKMVRAIIEYNVNNYKTDEQFQQDCHDMLRAFFKGITRG